MITHVTNHTKSCDETVFYDVIMNKVGCILLLKFDYIVYIIEE